MSNYLKAHTFIERHQEIARQEKRRGRWIVRAELAAVSLGLFVTGVVTALMLWR